MNFLFVALGGALGSVLRYFLSLVIPKVAGFPWPTFVANILGCLCIGIFCRKRPGLPMHRNFFGTLPQVRLPLAEPQALFGDGLLRRLYDVQHFCQRKLGAFAKRKIRDVHSLRASKLCTWRCRLRRWNLLDGLQSMMSAPPCDLLN